MEKGKNPNMEKVGRSESTPKIRLKCSNPHASFESGACDNGWNYNLQSDVYSHHVISRHSSEWCSILNHNKYEITLKEWLEKRKKKKENNWDDVYGKWEVYRPNEEARQIIQGILHAVRELHSHGSSHGFLNHPENFAIQEKDLVIGGDHKKSKRVFLIHENHDSSGVPTNNNTQQGDRLAVSNLIFDQILGATDEEWWYPQDLQNLRELLEQTNSVSSHDWKLITNHPSLWHWKSRFSYPEQVWMHYVNADYGSRVYRHINKGLRNIKVSGWANNIPSYTPLQSVYKFKNNYVDTTEDLLHYLRNVRDHYKEHVSRCSYDKKFSNPQFVELKITEVSELFLVDLYSLMCMKSIEI